MKRPLVSIVVAAIVVVLAVVLNPSPERHRQEIRRVMGDRNPIAGALGLGALKAFASNYHSLGVASYTKAGGRVLSVGALGIVYVLD